MIDVKFFGSWVFTVIVTFFFLSDFLVVSDGAGQEEVALRVCVYPSPDIYLVRTFLSDFKGQLMLDLGEEEIQEVYIDVSEKCGYSLIFVTPRASKQSEIVEDILRYEWPVFIASQIKYLDDLSDQPTEFKSWERYRLAATSIEPYIAKFKNDSLKVVSEVIKVRHDVIVRSKFVPSVLFSQLLLIIVYSLTRIYFHRWAH